MLGQLDLYFHINQSKINFLNSLKLKEKGLNKKYKSKTLSIFGFWNLEFLFLHKQEVL
jgi:hypothetical protein